jgi:short-chain fatty acids transporter
MTRSIDARSPRDRNEPDGSGVIARTALGLTAWAERWVPDAFVFALVVTVVVFALGVALDRAPVATLLESWGKGFWELISFAMQMGLIIVTGYVLATSRPVARAITRLARMPRTARGATAMVAFFAMATSWVNWGFSLIFAALLARETARHRPEADYRALAASSFLGLGSVWAQGLSGSAALQMATPEALPPKLREIVAAGGLVPGGVIPLRSTIFTWQSLTSVAIEILLVSLVAWSYAPSPERAAPAEKLGVSLAPLLKEDEEAPSSRALTPAERVERSRALGLLVALMGLCYLGIYLARAPAKLAAINVNTINFAFLMLGILLHGTPERLLRAVRDATPATAGVILQFPFYGGIAGMIAYTGLSARIAHAFVDVSTHVTFPPLVAAYSALLGVFVPSGGGKWVIEAPYVMQAAHQLRVHLGWTVAVYDLGEALANLVQPFWMLPTLAILGLRARDVMGYTFVVFLVLAPVVVTLVTVLGTTLGYPM